MMIIQGLGIDYADGEITATAEILNNLGSGAAGGEDTPETRSRVFSGSGKTISEAVKEIAFKCGSEPLYAHTRVVILGEKAADKNLADVLDFFERDYNTKPAMLICVAKGCTARELLESNTAQNGVKSEIIEDILKTGNDLSVVPRVRVLEAVCITEESESSLLIPSVSEKKSGETSEYILSGCAVFKSDNTLFGYIDENTSSALMFLKNKVNKGSITASLPSGAKASMLIVKSKTKYNIEIKDGISCFLVNIYLSADLNEFSNGVFEKLGKDEIKIIEDAAENELEKSAFEAFCLLRDDFSCDALRLTKMLSLKKPRYFKSLTESERENIFKNCTVKINAEVTIRRTGDEGFDFS